MNQVEEEIKEFLLNNNLSQYSVNDIAQKFYVSRNQIYKVCRYLGYNSYTKLKYELSERKNVNDMQEEINVRFSQSNLSQVSQAIIEIKKAEKIYLIGTNATSIVCEYFARQLINLGYFAITITDSLLVNKYVDLINSEDIVICFSNSGETNSSIQFIKQIKGVSISITRADSKMYSVSDFKIEVDTNVSKFDSGYEKENIFSLILVAQTILTQLKNE